MELLVACYCQELILAEQALALPSLEREEERGGSTLLPCPSLCRSEARTAKWKMAMCHMRVEWAASAQVSCLILGSRTQVLPPLHFHSR